MEASMSKELKKQRRHFYKEEIDKKLDQIDKLENKIKSKQNLMKESEKYLSEYVVKMEILENEIDFLSKYLKTQE